MLGYKQITLILIVLNNRNIRCVRIRITSNARLG